MDVPETIISLGGPWALPLKLAFVVWGLRRLLHQLQLGLVEWREFRRQLHGKADGLLEQFPDPLSILAAEHGVSFPGEEAGGGASVPSHKQ